MQPSTFPNKSLIRQSRLQEQLDLTRGGLEKLRKKDQAFPKPIKDGDSRQAAAYYVVSEVEAWLQAKIAERDAALIASQKLEPLQTKTTEHNYKVEVA